MLRMRFVRYDAVIVCACGAVPAVEHNGAACIAVAYDPWPAALAIAAGKKITRRRVVSDARMR
jgi:hypothetical protein